MEDTYQLTAIVLHRVPYREFDSRLTLYSREKGKIELVARGVKKIRSKIAGHIEPLNLIEAMAVRGRQYDYLGGAISTDCRARIKSDLIRLTLAGQAVSFFNKMVRAGEKDESLFDLLELFLVGLANQESAKLEWLLPSFILKLLSKLGYRPELYQCVQCGRRLDPGGNKFDFSRGGVICRFCLPDGHLTISDDCLKIIKFLLEKEFNEIKLLNIQKPLIAEADRFISSLKIWQIG